MVVYDIWILSHWNLAVQVGTHRNDYALLVTVMFIELIVLFNNCKSRVNLRPTGYQEIKCLFPR